MRQCMAAGIDVHQGVRVTAVDDPDFRHRLDPSGAPASATVHFGSGEQLECRLVMYACGRQSALLRNPGESQQGEEFRATGKDGMLGLKLHTELPQTGLSQAEGAQQPGSAVELHAFEGGYLGIAEVEGGRVNLCALLRSSVLRRAGKDPQRLGAEIMAANRTLARRLEHLQPDWTRALAVANLHFGPAPASGRMCIGDSAGAIAPLCVDGVSMALRGAQLAAPLVTRYLTGTIPGAEMLGRLRRQWRREFGLRIRLGNQLQTLLMSDTAGTLALTALKHLPALGRWAIATTRG